MKKNHRIFLILITNFVFLVSCSESIVVNPYNGKTFKTRLGKEILTTASYLDKVPFLSKLNDNSSIKKAYPMNYDGIPQDEEGYYNITEPVSRYGSYTDISTPLSYYDTYDKHLEDAKEIKDNALEYCTQLNVWRKDYLMIFDDDLNELKFFRKRTGRIDSSDGTSQNTLFLSMGDVWKDENGKINYKFSEYEIDTDLKEGNPLNYQCNLSYLEDSYYIYNYVSKPKTITAPTEDRPLVFSGNYTTHYFDLSNKNVMYDFSFAGYTNLDKSELKYLNATKKVNDFNDDYRLSIDYSGDSPIFALYDTIGNNAIVISDNQATLNLYDFNGWDSFYAESLESYPYDDKDKSDWNYKFKLTNNNINNVEFEPGVYYSGLVFSPYVYFVGYPIVKIAFNSYESLTSSISLMGLEYKGNKDEFNAVKQFIDGEKQYSFSGEPIDSVSDDQIVEFVLSKCENHEYQEIKKFVDYKEEPVDLYE